MGLRLLSLLMLAYVNYALPYLGLHGLADSFFPILVQYLVCLMVRLVAILLLAFFSSGFVCFVGTLRTRPGEVHQGVSVD